MTTDIYSTFLAEVCTTARALDVAGEHCATMFENLYDGILKEQVDGKWLLNVLDSLLVNNRDFVAEILGWMLADVYELQRTSPKAQQRYEALRAARMELFTEGCSPVLFEQVDSAVGDMR